MAPAVAAAAGLALIIQKLFFQGRRLIAAALLVTLAVFLVSNIGITLKLINVWKDTGSFWSPVIEIEPVGPAYGDRGVYYLINGRSAEAVDDLVWP